MQLGVLCELRLEVEGGFGWMTTKVKRIWRAHFDKYEPWLKQVFRKMCCYLKEPGFAPAQCSQKQALNNNYFKKNPASVALFLKEGLLSFL